MRYNKPALRKCSHNRDFPVQQATLRLSSTDGFDIMAGIRGNAIQLEALDGARCVRVEPVGLLRFHQRAVEDATEQSPGNSNWCVL